MANVDEKPFAKKLKSFIKQEKPELVGFGSLDEKIPIEYADRAAEMVESLVGMGCHREIAEQFAVLVLYDLVILLDDSSSMEYEEDGNRIKTLSKILRAIVDIYGLARDEGVVAVRFFNNSRPAKNLTRANVETVIKNIEYNGVTMIGTQLQDKILKRFVLKKKDMVRPVLAIIITDGHIEGEKDGLLKKNINNCLAKLALDTTKTVDAVAFMFARIGNDAGAQNLLEELDDHETLGRWIDCLPVDYALEKIGNLTEFRKSGDGGEQSEEEIKKLKERWNVIRKLLLGALYADIDKMDRKKEEAKEEVELKFEPKTVRPEDFMDAEYALVYDPDPDDDDDDDDDDDRRRQV